jgi:hypothetical protein
MRSPDLASSYQDRGATVRLVRGSAYPWPVAPQQSRRPFRLIF